VRLSSLGGGADVASEDSGRLVAPAAAAGCVISSPGALIAASSRMLPPLPASLSLCAVRDFRCPGNLRTDEHHGCGLVRVAPPRIAYPLPPYHAVAEE